LALALGVSSASFALADDAHHAPTPNPTAGATASMAEGEVKKVAKDTGKITIKHGKLKNLGMPPMTMVFRVKDPAMIEQVKPGDKINFIADKVEGQFTVMKLEVVE
jgi:Cu/Ag efflux protein CusF